MADDVATKWMTVARLLRPQGRRGELLTEPLTDLPGVLEAGRQVWLVAANTPAPATAEKPLSIEEQWSPTGRNAGLRVLKLSGCDSINDAEKLAGLQVMVSVTDLPPLEADTFMVADLLGCLLLDDSVEVGRVVDVQFAVGPDGRTRLPDAAPLLAIDRAAFAPDEVNGPGQDTDAPQESEADQTLLIPFVQAWLGSVDLVAKRIVMHLPEGLVDRKE